MPRMLKLLLAVVIAKFALFALLMLWTKSVAKSVLGAWLLAALAGWWLTRRETGERRVAAAA